MSLFITALNSGSNANCYYVGNDDEAILVDAGLSCRETEKRMLQLELSMERVKAIFVSHEHGDHISGLAGLSKKYRLPVYITAATLSNCSVPIDPQLVYSFQKNKAIKIGRLAVMPFGKSHDAADPHSFMISGNGVNIGVITDIGYACKQVINYFSSCHAVFLEANYCDDMLTNGSYPYHLKRRISSDEGHLSNAQALDLFTNYRSPGLQLLILSHLSKNNNKPELVEKIFSGHVTSTQVVVASRYAATPIFCIKAVEGSVQNPIPIPVKPKQRKRDSYRVMHENQLSLF